MTSCGMYYCVYRKDGRCQKNQSEPEPYEPCPYSLYFSIEEEELEQLKQKTRECFEALDGPLSYFACPERFCIYQKNGYCTAGLQPTEGEICQECVFSIFPKSEGKN